MPADGARNPASEAPIRPAMETLVLYFRDEPLREFALEGRPLEVGSDGSCDIVIHDPDVAARALLVNPAGGTVVAYDLVKAGRQAGPSPVPHGAPIAVGAHHRLVRLPRAPLAPPCALRHDGATERLETSGAPGEPLVLVVGRGRDARRRRVGPKALTVGKAPGNDVVLEDRAVSAVHCRFEPSPSGVVVRDLGSRNGTWVAGAMVKTVALRAGAVVKVGRTELRLERDVDAGTPPPAGTTIARSAAMRELVAEAERLAVFDVPVLVTGESGAGKEGIARLLHERGPRAKGPFVAVNAGGLAPQLVESELFGHTKGAFTGAVADHRGAFEQAAGGTLFLDEIGELPLQLQARLLRVLDGWKVRRVGGEGEVAVDVRLVCATHRDLAAMVRAGTFREDLHYRIRQEVLHVAPLRERPEDVAALAEHFLRALEPEVGERALSEEAVARLLAHPFPGNVRELKSVVQGAARRSASRVLGAEDVARALARVGGAPSPKSDDRGLLEVLARHGGNTAAAASALGIPRTTLRDRLRRAARARAGEADAGAPDGGGLSE